MQAAGAFDERPLARHNYLQRGCKRAASRGGALPRWNLAFRRTREEAEVAAKTKARRHAPPPTPAPPPERVALTVPEAATVLGLGQSTVWAMLNRGVLPRVRVGRSTRISRTAIDEFMAVGGNANIDQTAARGRELRPWVGPALAVAGWLYHLVTTRPRRDKSGGCTYDR